MPGERHWYCQAKCVHFIGPAINKEWLRRFQYWGLYTFTDELWNISNSLPQACRPNIRIISTYVCIKFNQIDPTSRSCQHKSASNPTYNFVDSFRTSYHRVIKWSSPAPIHPLSQLRCTRLLIVFPSQIRVTQNVGRLSDQSSFLINILLLLFCESLLSLQSIRMCFDAHFFRRLQHLLLRALRTDAQSCIMPDPASRGYWCGQWFLEFRTIAHASWMCVFVMSIQRFPSRKFRKTHFASRMKVLKMLRSLLQVCKMFVAEVTVHYLVTNLVVLMESIHTPEINNRVAVLARFVLSGRLEMIVSLCLSSELLVAFNAFEIERATPQTLQILDISPISTEFRRAEARSPMVRFMSTISLFRFMSWFMFWFIFRPIPRWPAELAKVEMHLYSSPKPKKAFVP